MGKKEQVTRELALLTWIRSKGDPFTMIKMLNNPSRNDRYEIKSTYFSIFELDELNWQGDITTRKAFYSRIY
jgi:hypothetical protein